MNNSNVLIISYYFPPIGLSGVQRTLKFVKYLPEFGWNPIVITSSPSTYYAFDETLLEEVSRPGVNIFRTITKISEKKDQSYYKITRFPSYPIQKIGRIFYQTFYQPDRFIKWKKHAIELAQVVLKEYKIDVIYATAPPFTDFLVARELSRKHKIPFIIDYRDPWVDNPFHYYPTPLHKQYCINLESDILTHSRRAIVTTRYIKELLLKRYKFLSYDEITIIPHGYDPEDFEKVGNVNKKPEKFIITHSGIFQDDRTPYYFLKALANWLEKKQIPRKKIEARFIGVMRKSHLKYINKFKLNDVVVCTGYLPHLEAIKNLLESDVLWLTQNENIRCPGKLFEYFGAKKTILACIPEGIIRKIAMESKSAFATNPKDISAIEENINLLFELWKYNRLPVPSDSFCEQYNRKNLTKLLAKELALATEI